MMREEPLHIKTPLIRSLTLTSKFGRDVFLKLENLQPSGSFKIRGIGRTCQMAVRESGAKRFVGSSGGNAGLALAYAAKMLAVPATVFVPVSTPSMMVKKILELGAEVRVSGPNWDAANEKAVEYLEENEDSYFVHPFGQESTWIGHSSIVSEIRDQLREEFGYEIPPSGISVSVGGGGLALGVLLGFKEVGWNVPLIAMETEGADCLNAALKAKAVVELEAITSICTSLGARSIAPKLFELANDGNVISKTVSDKAAFEACLKLADDHRLLVEPACGAALCGAGILKRSLKNSHGPFVIIVCGGSMASLELFQKWARYFRL